MKSIEQLTPEQVAAATSVAARPEIAILADMGVGKTVISLTGLNSNPYKLPALVLSTVRVVDLVWAQEAAEWKHLRYLRFSRIRGTPIQRLAAMQLQADVYLMNVENIGWLMGHPEFTNRIRTLVLDELSLWKGGGTRWKTLRTFAATVPNILGLTGTPAPHSYLDLWPQMELIHEGMLMRSKTAFKTHYFYPADPNGYRWELRAGGQREILGRMAPYVVRIAAPASSKPQLQVNTIQLTLPDEVYDYMRDIKRDGLIDIGDSTIIAESQGVAVNKMAQISNGAVYDPDGNVVPVHNHRVKACVELVNEMQGTPVLVAYHYAHDLERLSAALPNAPVFNGDLSGPQAERLAEHWNAGRIPVMLVQPAAAGHGLNLQKGDAHHIIWFAFEWSLDLYEQLNARLCRQGNKSPVVYVHHIVSSPIDRAMAWALQNRKEVQQGVLEYFAEEGE